MDALPTLSPEGFITNRTIMMTKLYEYFISSEQSQSNTFFGEVVSLKYIISEAANPTELQDMTLTALTKMYSKYFASVAVDITVTSTDNTMAISVNIRTVDDVAKTYQLSEIVNVTDNNITNHDTQQEGYYA